MGGTDETLAATKAANNEALADATAQIAINGDRRKDSIEQQYQYNKADLNDKLNNMEVNKAKAVAQAAQGVADAGAGFGDLDFGTYKTKGGKEIAL